MIPVIEATGGWSSMFAFGANCDAVTGACGDCVSDPSTSGFEFSDSPGLVEEGLEAVQPEDGEEALVGRRLDPVAVGDVSWHARGRRGWSWSRPGCYTAEQGWGGPAAGCGG